MDDEQSCDGSAFQTVRAVGVGGALLLPLLLCSVCKGGGQIQGLVCLLFYELSLYVGFL